MGKISKEKEIVGQMVRIYCRKHHLAGNQRGGVCEQCEALLNYAHQRLDRCPKGDSKGSCRRCENHCYAPSRREAMRAVMRYVGPRMILYNPLAAIRHLINEFR